MVFAVFIVLVVVFMVGVLLFVVVSPCGWCLFVSFYGWRFLVVVVGGGVGCCC